MWRDAKCHTPSKITHPTSTSEADTTRWIFNPQVQKRHQPPQGCTASGAHMLSQRTTWRAHNLHGVKRKRSASSNDKLTVAFLHPLTLW